MAAALRALAEPGRVLEGEFRPGGHGREWCDADVLQTLRRRSLARLRKQVEPAPRRPRWRACWSTGRASPPPRSPRRAAGPTRCST